MSKRRDADVVIIVVESRAAPRPITLPSGARGSRWWRKGRLPARPRGGTREGCGCRAGTRVEYPFMLECIKMWEGLEKELGADIGYVSGGNLLYVENEEDMKEIERELGWLRSTGSIHTQ